MNIRETMTIGIKTCSITYSIINNMFKIKPDLTWDEIIENGEEYKEVCLNISLHWVENLICSNGACFSKKNLKPLFVESRFDRH